MVQHTEMSFAPSVRAMLDARFSAVAKLLVYLYYLLVSTGDYMYVLMYKTTSSKGHIQYNAHIVRMLISLGSHNERYNEGPVY